MKFIKLLLIPLLALPILTNTAIAASKKDVTTCTSPGADPTGVTDSATAIQNCLNSAGSEAAIYFPPGQYKIGSTLTVSQNNVTLYSDSRATAKLNFTTGCGDLIYFTKGTTEMFNGGVRGLWLQGSNGGSCSQTGLHVNDISAVTIDDVQITGFTATTDQSIGIQTNGRELFRVRDSQIAANKPIVIAKNPNTLTTYSLDADHFHFENLYTQVLGTGQHWHFTLLDQVMVSNTTIDGQNPMTGGCGILQWVSTTPPTSVSYNLKISNIRLEQLTAGCDKQIDIELPTTMPLQSLIVDNVYMSIYPAFAGTGIYLKSVQGLTARDVTYWNPVANATLPPATFINASGIRFIELQNNHIAVFGQKIIAQDDSVVPVNLIPKAGPFTGKECCYQVGGTGPWIRSSDSGIWGQP